MNYIFKIFFLLCFSLHASDYLTIEKQNKEMNKAFINLPVISSNDKSLDEDEEKPDPTTILNETLRTKYLSGKNVKSAIVTQEDLQIRNKMVSTKILHNLNDTLNFLLTTQQIISDHIYKDPKLFRFTLYTTSTNNSLDFPLNNFPSPFNDFTQGVLMLTSTQYWTDIIALFKNTIFCDGTQNSFEENTGVLVKKVMPTYLDKLKEIVASLNKKIPMPLENKEAAFLENIVNNFYPLLLDCLIKLYEVLPDELVAKINPRQMKKFATVFDRQEENVQKTATIFAKKLSSHDVIYNNVHVTLKIIRSRELFEVMEKYLSESEIIAHVKDNPFYKSMFFYYKQRYDDNYAIFLDEINELMIKWQENRTNFQLPGKLFNGIKWFELSCLAFIKAYPDLNKVSEFQEPQESKEHKEDKAEKEEELEENFDYEYFQQEHAYHQQRKNQAHIENIEVPAVLSDYEIKLFNFIKNNIYNCKNKQTWNQLVKGLSDLGFEGKANTFGNGSTWVFSVNKKNKLFFNDKKYKNATFNVHKFSGNGPINAQYLKFFQSGLANVFGLSKDYIESLE